MKKQSLFGFMQAKSPSVNRGGRDFLALLGVFCLTFCGCQRVVSVSVDNRFTVGVKAFDTDNHYLGYAPAQATTRLKWALTVSGGRDIVVTFKDASGTTVARIIKDCDRIESEAQGGVWTVTVGK